MQSSFSIRLTPFSVAVAQRPRCLPLHKSRPIFPRLRCKATDTEKLPTDNTGSNVVQGEMAEAEWKWIDSDDAAWAHGLGLMALLLGSVPSLYEVPFSQSVYFLSLATLTIYIGAHRSLNADVMEQFNLRQSLLAPIFASCFLFGIYLLIKYFPGLSLQTIIDIQIGIVGTYAVSRMLGPFLKKIAPLTALEVPSPPWMRSKKSSRQRLRGADVLTTGLAIGCIALDVFTGHHLHTLNNFIACSLAIEVLQSIGIGALEVGSIRIGSFISAAALLIGLLVYDVFWVFYSPDVVGENVMLTVATSNVIEGPLKLLFPSGRGSYPFSILGLGDIAIPGILAGLVLRFDAFGKKTSSVTSSNLNSDRMQRGEDDASTSEEWTMGPEVMRSRSYFLPVLGSYVFGLLLASAVNVLTDKGQPALLYIVPCMLLTSIGLSAARGDVRSMFQQYTDPERTRSENEEMEH